ncbi:protein ecdysoneless homolog [Panonychus citri]|uniref:protein ecdysoneless homolog n=1 Tax=Panonychus citri TaxID=50023 RepID=UPI0023072BA2|nr:protein ecdysoneless homolog [Panonychus citri]
MASNNNQVVLKDNTVHYCLYPDFSLISDESTHIDHLKDYIVDCFNKLSDLLKDYLWHFEEFNLRPVDSSSDQVAHIEGFTCYEDNVEDEWFIVYLLIKLTQLDSKLVISVKDSDGQFLLIEAAEYLPKWAEPEISDQRVFIFNGEVHLIPPSVIPQTKNICDSSIDITQALSVIRDEGKKTKCAEKIQYSIRRRITMFPMQITTQKHRAQCFIPAGVAMLLSHQPNLISWAVRAFYHRDLKDFQAIRSMKYFPPETRVKRNVTFTKCLYAQAISQKYDPDPKIGWNLPPRESPLFKSYDLGVKIACGFEILISRVKATNSCDETSPISTEKCNEKLWVKMVKSLEDKGYFKDNIQGSRRYKELLNKAYDFYRSSMESSKDSVACDEDIGQRVLKLVKTVSVDYDRLKREESSLEPEDSDDWINISQQKLEDVLIGQFLNDKDLNENLAEKIPEAFKTFINYDDVGIEGAEIPVDNLRPNITHDLEPIKFDEDKFGDALKNILSFPLPSTESSSSSSGMSDYEMESAPDEKDSSDSDGDNPTFRILTPVKSLSKTKKVTKRKKHKNNKSNSTNPMFKDMKHYMEAIDRELDKTLVGKSFERKPKSNNDQVKIGEPPLATCDEDEDLDDTDNESTLPPVDPELTALKNILESFDSQKGLPGPGSNLLSLMGVHLPRDSSSSSQPK